MTDVFLYPVGVMGLLLFPVPRVDALIEGTGIAAVCAVGTVVTSGAAFVGITGVAASVAIGSAVESGTALIIATGLAAGAALGTVTDTGDANLSALGVSAVGALGIVTPTGDLAPVGESVGGMPGHAHVALIVPVVQLSVRVFVDGVEALAQVGYAIGQGTASDQAEALDDAWLALQRQRQQIEDDDAEVLLILLGVVDD